MGPLILDPYKANEKPQVTAVQARAEREALELDRVIAARRSRGRGWLSNGGRTG